MVKLLIQAAPEYVNAQDRSGNTAMHYAVAKGNVEIVAALCSVEGIDLNIDQHTKLGILGPNGGGKSTLIKLILGMLKPSQGSIKIFDQTPQQARAKDLHIRSRVRPEVRVRGAYVHVL